MMTAEAAISRNWKNGKAKEMKMKNMAARAIALAGAVAAAVACCGADGDDPQMESGGLVEVPAKGCVAVVDCRGAGADASLDEPVSRLEGFTRVRFARLARDGFSLDVTPVEAMAAAGAQAAVFIADDARLPMSLVSTEGGWGVVNVAALRADGAAGGVLAARLRKEFMRVAVLSLGGWRSDMPGSFLGKVRSPKDLDSLEGRGITLFELRNVMNHLLDIGVTRAYSISYRDLCREGRAPAPTNAVQKAIWEQVQAEKERGPAKAIAIPPPAKGK